MDLNGYFDPVSLDRPEFHLVPEEYSFSRAITIHTPDHPVKNLESYDMAIIGVPEDEKAFIRGSAAAPDKVRGMLYQLRKLNGNIKIYDLGNLKKSKNSNDVYYAIRDITLELKENQIIPFFIGGSQDLTYGLMLALEKQKGYSHVVTIDPRLDFWTDRVENLNSRNYLNMMFKEETEESFLYTNIGHQQYFVTQEQLDMIEQKHLESFRLGEIRTDIRKSEPLLRDADILSIDMSAVRHSDAPGVITPTPNGFFGDELCALTRYAGLSDNLKACGLFELAPDNDLNDQTSHLAAQTIWYFIDGLAFRIKENPADKHSHTKKFIVHMNAIDQDLTFYKSNVSDRWWLEIPVKNNATNHNFFISCSYEDYQQACNNEITDRWWRYLHRLKARK